MCGLLGARRQLAPRAVPLLLLLHFVVVSFSGTRTASEQTSPVVRIEEWARRASSSRT